MSLRVSTLGAALVLAVALHLALGAGLFWSRETKGAIGAGAGGVEVSIGAAGGIPGTADLLEPEQTISDAPGAADPVQADQADITETDTIPDSAPEQVEARTAPEVPQLEVETTPPDSPTNPTPLEKPALEAAPAPAVADLVPIPVDMIAEAPQAVPVEVAPVLAEPAPTAATETQATLALAQPKAPVETVEAEEPDDLAAVPRPRTKPPVPKSFQRKTTRKKQKKTTQTRTTQKVTKRPAQKAARTELPATRSQASTQSAATVESGGNASSSGSRGAAASPQSGGDPNAKRSYQREVQRILARNKRYPRRAKSRGQQGLGKLFIKISSDGRILVSSVKQSAGHSLLDREILALVKRVGKLPPFPKSMAETSIQLVVPIRFALK